MFSPDHMQQAMNMFQNMSPEQRNQMFAQVNQNPNMMNQARNMFQGNTPTNQNFPNNTNVNQQQKNPQEFRELQKIQELKKQGDSHYKLEEYELAGSKYLEAIYEIEDLRNYKKTLLEQQQQKDLVDQLEVKVRNNYCMSKKALNEEEMMMDHSKRVLEIDSSNVKALYNLSLAQLYLKEYKEGEKCLEKALSLQPNQQSLLDLQQRFKDCQQQRNFKHQQKNTKLNDKSSTTKVQEIKKSVPNQKEEINKRESQKQELWDYSKNQKIKTKDEKEIQEKNHEEDQVIDSKPQKLVKGNQIHQKNTFSTSTQSLKAKKQITNNLKEILQKKFPIQQTNPINISNQIQKVELTFLERNFKILVGILLGLFISYMLKKNQEINN